MYNGVTSSRSARLASARTLVRRSSSTAGKGRNIHSLVIHTSVIHTARSQTHSLSPCVTAIRSTGPLTRKQSNQVGLGCMEDSRTNCSKRCDAHRAVRHGEWKCSHCGPRTHLLLTEKTSSVTYAKAINFGLMWLGDRWLSRMTSNSQLVLIWKVLKSLSAQKPIGSRMSVIGTLHGATTGATKLALYCTLCVECRSCIANAASVRPACKRQHDRIP
ncbi:hypothetical protein C8Q74DRAFT_578699 [Fomes fomentarius]|nr:hypothetical protein C8Q74DRAFT_578699 [Fomes fomentarius]